MYGQMKKYKDSIKNTPGPIMPSQIPEIHLDLKGLMEYAKKTGRKVTELLEEEMQRFLIKEAQRGSTEIEAYRNLMEIIGIEFPKESTGD